MAERKVNSDKFLLELCPNFLLCYFFSLRALIFRGNYPPMYFLATGKIDLSFRTRPTSVSGSGLLIILIFPHCSWAINPFQIVDSSLYEMTAEIPQICWRPRRPPGHWHSEFEHGPCFFRPKRLYFANFVQFFRATDHRSEPLREYMRGMLKIIIISRVCTSG